MSQWYQFSPVDEERRILRFRLKGFWHGSWKDRRCLASREPHNL